MTKIAARQLRRELAQTLKRVDAEGERVVIHRNGRAMAALVPARDLRLLKEIEDRADLTAARKALREAAAKGERPIAWEIVKKRLGL